MSCWYKSPFLIPCRLSISTLLISMVKCNKATGRRHLCCKNPLQINKVFRMEPLQQHHHNQIPQLQVSQTFTTDPPVSTSTTVPNNVTATSPSVENNDSVAAPDGGNEDDGGWTALDCQTVFARALGLPGCDFQEAPFSKHKRKYKPISETSPSVANRDS